MSKRRLTAQAWRELLGRQRSSGLTVEAFCRQEDLALSTFFAWRRRLALRDEPAFVEVACDVPCDVQSSQAVDNAAPSSMLRAESMSATRSDAISPGASAPSCGAIELLLPGGVRVRVREGFDASTLRRVVEVLS